MKLTPIARAERYQSFARLFLIEPDGETLEQGRYDIRFAKAIAIDSRDLRVEFTRLFALNVFPYASVFLDPEGLLNTETTARVQARYAETGFVPSSAVSVGAVDHFGLELSFGAYLLSSGRDDAANQFIQAELLAWAEIFLYAVERNARQDFYRLLAQETRRWLLDDFNSFWDGVKPPHRDTLAEFAAPGIEENDLESIVSFLISPSRSGIFLSKDDLSAIGRRLELPVSFGDRGLMLKSLFRSAGEFQKIEVLLAALNAEINDWMEQYSSDREYCASTPSILHPWISRATATFALLRDMEQASETGSR